MEKEKKLFRITVAYDIAFIGDQEDKAVEWVMEHMPLGELDADRYIRVRVINDTRDIPEGWWESYEPYGDNPRELTVQDWLNNRRLRQISVKMNDAQFEYFMSEFRKFDPSVQVKTE